MSNFILDVFMKGVKAFRTTKNSEGAETQHTSSKQRMCAHKRSEIASGTK